MCVCVHVCVCVCVCVFCSEIHVRGNQHSHFHTCRFEVLPTIMDPQAEHESTGDLRPMLPYTIRSLSRSASQPVVFSHKHLDRRLNKLSTSGHHSGSRGAGGGGTGEGGMEAGNGSGSRHEDDLDIIKQIIEKDESLHDTADQVRQVGMHLRSQSLSHIPGEFSSVSSLPTLHHAESMLHLHSNYFSAPDFSQLRSPPGYNAMLEKHSAGGVGTGDGGGDGSYHQLTHESRSSSLGDCHAPLGTVTNQQQSQQLVSQQVDKFSLNEDRRGSNFDSQGMVSSYDGAQSAPLTLSHHSEGFGSPHMTTYDFTRHGDSGLSYSESDNNQTPVGYGHERGSISDSVSAAASSMSFQFPSLSSTNPLLYSNSSTSQGLASPHLEAGETTSSSLPLRDYLTSQPTTSSLVAGPDQFERKGGCSKAVSGIETPSLAPVRGSFVANALGGSKGNFFLVVISCSSVSIVTLNIFLILILWANK